MIIKRTITYELLELSRSFPIVTITGPRQSGKTTLAKNTFPNKAYVTLESPDQLDLALSDPRKFLRELNNNAIIDEIQRAPQLLSYLQEIVDNNNNAGQFILTGSQQFELLQKVTQSLAGRTGLLKLLPFSLEELQDFEDRSLNEIIFTGFYPRIFDKNLNPTTVYRNYYETYIERDVRQLIAIKDLSLFKKFMRLCAGRIGHIFVASHLANEVGVSVPTINSWLSVLEASYILYLLPPFYSNSNKRLIKSPKLYFYDTGLASYLLRLEDTNQLSRDPLRGNLFENLVVLEVLKTRYNLGKDSNLYFYRDSNQNEIDLIYESKRKVVAVEIKSAETFSRDYLKGLNYFEKNFSSLITKKFLCYAGHLQQNINGTELINFRYLSKNLSKL